MMNTNKKMLDLFAGSRSVSKIFEEAGYDVTSVDILWGQDVITWEPDGYYDFVWASPPCDTYTAVKEIEVIPMEVEA